MVTPKEALKIILKSKVETKIENVSIDKSVGRFLAKDIFSDIDMPPFNKSAMDGYAYRKEDAENPLEIIGQIAAGTISHLNIKENLCAKIMTGAMLPAGADAVVRVEFTKQLSQKIEIIKKDSTNIAFQGEDIRKGMKVLERGSKLTPASIAVLASVGYSNIPVYKKPLVAVISTGSEIVEPDMQLKTGKIRNSNAYQLIAGIQQAGGEAHYLGIAEDKLDAITNAVKVALCSCDILLLSGGVSMGDFDFVPAALKANNVETIFEKIKIKPGRPTLFAGKGNSKIFGLPGNPASSFIIFEIFVRPLIAKLLGAKYKPVTSIHSMKKDYFRKKADRLSYIPVFVNEKGQVEIESYHGSAHIHAFSNADGILAIPEGVNTIKAGEQVEINLL